MMRMLLDSATGTVGKLASWTISVLTSSRPRNCRSFRIVWICPISSTSSSRWAASAGTTDWMAGIPVPSMTNRSISWVMTALTAASSSSSSWSRSSSAWISGAWAEIVD